MNAEYLKDLYNESYKKSKDLWSVNDLKKTNQIAKRIVKYIYRRELSLIKNNSFLDIGCAKGQFTESFRALGFDSYGFDYSDIAIELAKMKFPNCNFFVMNGFEPNLNKEFDVIYMKNFSGTNTHDLEFVASICNKYVEFLSKDGWFILSYSTDFSGKEAHLETVNWTHQEFIALARKIQNMKLLDIKYFSHSLIWRCLRKVLNFMGVKRKQEFYLMFKKGV